MIGIYKITNQINGKCYIGQSINITERWKAHRTRYHQPSCKDYECPLYRAMRKYELENFSFEIIEDCSNLAENENKRQELNKREIYWISYFHSNEPDFGYNLTPGGDAQCEKVRKFSEKQILEIKEQLIAGITQTDIAKKYNVSQTTISYINLGREYFHEDWDYPLSKRKKDFFCKRCGKKITKYSKGYCSKCYSFTSRKVERPSRDELKKMIREQQFTKIANMFGVTSNTIRRWCISENLPSRKMDIDKISDEDWLLI